MSAQITSLIKYLLFGTLILISAKIISDGLKSNGTKMKEGLRNIPHSYVPNELTIYHEDNEKWKYTLEKDADLCVELSSGRKVIISGTDIVAKFIYTPRILVVTYKDTKNRKAYFHAFEPISWEAIKH